MSTVTAISIKAGQTFKTTLYAVTATYTAVADAQQDPYGEQGTVRIPVTYEGCAEQFFILRKALAEVELVEDANVTADLQAIREWKEAKRYPETHTFVYRPHTAEQYREQAQQCREERARSWEDSDSDGFLSQWANSQMEGRYLSLASVAEDNWMIEQAALFDLQGQLVAADYREGQYGMYWGILDPANPARFKEFFSESKARSEKVRVANNAKKGYYVGTVRVPAEQDMRTAYAAPVIEYWEQGAVIVDNGQ